jgi:hypothetical protein
MCGSQNRCGRRGHGLRTMRRGHIGPSIGPLGALHGGAGGTRAHPGPCKEGKGGRPLQLRRARCSVRMARSWTRSRVREWEEHMTMSESVRHKRDRQLKKRSTYSREEINMGRTRAKSPITWGQYWTSDRHRAVRRSIWEEQENIPETTMNRSRIPHGGQCGDQYGKNN